MHALILSNYSLLLEAFCHSATGKSKHALCVTDVTHCMKVTSRSQFLCCGCCLTGTCKYEMSDYIQFMSLVSAFQGNVIVSIRTD
jgi:hypothetical protein